MRPESGFEHGLRSGISLPAGESASGQSIRDEIEMRVPVWVDIGYRLDPRTYVALFGQIGLDSAGGGCRRLAPSARPQCTTEDWRLGFEAFLFLRHTPASSLWIGAGLGWEHVNQVARFVVEDEELGQLAAGLEEVQQGPILELQGGLEWPIAGKLRWGPFAGYAAGMYVDRSYECRPGVPCPEDSFDLALHHFFTLGLRGAFGP